MTEDERREAERLARIKYPADDSHCSEQLERDCYVEGYAAACEAKAAEIKALKTELLAFASQMREVALELLAFKAKWKARRG